MANIYLPKALPLTEPPVEQKMLCLGTCGAAEDFFALKGTLEAFAGANDLTFTYKRGEVAYLHPGRTAECMPGAGGAFVPGYPPGHRKTEAVRLNRICI